MATFESSLKSRLIYIFAIGDEWHRNCLKIGETTLEEDNGDLLAPNDPLLQDAARKRIDQYTKTAGIAYQLLHTELTIYIKGGTVCSFNDKQVHTVLERSGIKKKVFDTVKGANEWYCCDLETAKNAIKAVKNGQTSLKPGDITQEQTPIVFRPEQSKAIEMTIKQFKRSNQMLWNAKMRFGKTLSALEVVKQEEFTRLWWTKDGLMISIRYSLTVRITTTVPGTKVNCSENSNSWQPRVTSMSISHLCRICEAQNS